MRLRDLTIRQRLNGMVFGGAVGLILVLGLALACLSTFRVNGPVYREVMTQKDFLADMLPPPLYIVEAYLVLHIAEHATDPEVIRTHRETFARLERDYHERTRHWAARVAHNSVHSQLIAESSAAADLFFTAANEQFFPALEKGDHAVASATLDGHLNDHYAKHRAAIDRSIAIAKGTTREIEATTARRVDFWLASMLIVTIVSVSGTAIIGSSITRSVLTPTADLICRIEEVAASNDQSTPVLNMPSGDEIGRLAKGIDAIILKLLTALKQSRIDQSQLRETKERLEAFIDAVPMATMVLGRDRCVYLWNKAAEEIFGWRAEEVLGKIRPMVPDAEAAMYERLRNQLLSDKPVRNIRMMGMQKSGRTIPVSGSARPLHDASGNVTHAIVVYDDITDWVEAQEQLKRERDFNAAILSTAPSLVLVLDAEGRVVVFNTACERCTGYTFDEVSGKPFWELLMPENEGREVFAAWNQIRVNRQLAKEASINSETLWLAKDRSVRRVAWATTVTRNDDGSIRYVIATGTDVTRQRSTEAALRAVVEGTSRAVGEDYFKHLVRQIAKSLGLPWVTLAVLSKDWGVATTLAWWHGEFLPNTDYKLDGTPCQRVIETGRCHVTRDAAKEFPGDEWMLRKGIVGYLGVRLEDQAGNPLGVLSLMSESPMEDTVLADSLLPIFGNRAAAEIERLRAESESSKLRTRLQNIIDSMPSALAGVDANGIVTHWNHEAQTLTGLDSASAVDRRAADVLPIVAPHSQRVEAALRDRVTQRLPRISRGTGDDRRLFDVTIFPLVANGAADAIVRIDDVTERTRMEEMVIQSEKMLSLGGLAAGMAHEINNPLAGMMASAQVIRNRLASDLPANERAAADVGVNLESIRAYAEARGIPKLLASIQETGQRAASIVENMLRFSRKSNSLRRLADLPALVSRTLEIARSDFDVRRKYDFRAIEVIREFDENLPPVLCQETEIQQVILNLVKNAGEAMLEKPVATKPPRLVIRLAREPDAVRLEVEDNGPGMSEDVRRRVFEPFFTTKQGAAGTGLGLPVSYFIITHNHGGTIMVDSEPDRGTRFVIRLPIHEKEPQT